MHTILGILQKVLSWILFPLRLFGYATDVYTLWSKKDWALTVGAPLLVSGLIGARAFAQQYPTPIIAMVVGGILLIAFWLMALVVEYIRNRRDNDGGRPTTPTEPEPPRGPRTGIRTRGGSFRSTGQMRIRNQDHSIDSEDTNWETKDTDIE